MNILRYYEAKQQNRKIVDLLRDLDRQGKLRELPGKWHDHYMKFPKIQETDEEDQILSHRFGVLVRDKYLIRILTCADTLNGHLNKRNGDVYITGAQTCDEKICAVCGTKQARRVYSQMSWQFQQLADQNYKYFFLTLTLPNNMTGFAREYKIYKDVSRDLFKYLRYNGQWCDLCHGIFGTYELTHTQKKGWHPHLHLCLAYKADEIVTVRADRRGQIKKFVVKAHNRTLDTSAFEIRQRFLDLIKKKHRDYYDEVILPRGEHLNIGFEECYNIDDKCNELCKYFCDYSTFMDSNTLFEFMRDIYRFNKYVKIGCFGWDKSKEAAWKESLDKPRRNLHFIQLDINPQLAAQDPIYFGTFYGMLHDRKTAVNVLYPSADIEKDVTFHYDRKRKCYVTYTYVDGERYPLHDYPLEYLRRMCYEPRQDMTQLLEYHTQIHSKGGKVDEGSS